MRVILNMATLRSHGSARVGQGVLMGLGRVARDHQFLAFVPDQWDVVPFTQYEHIHIHRVANGWAGKLLAETWLIQRAFSRFGADRLFSLTNTSVLASPVPHLLLVQQAYLAYDPVGFRFALPVSFRARLLLMAYVFCLSMRSVDRFTVQNASMRRHLCARWKIEPARVSVVSSAVDVGNGVACVEDSCVARRPYVCYVAGPSPYKNFAIVIDMLRELDQRGIRLDCHLTVCSDQFPALEQRARQLGVADQIVWRGSLSRSDVLSLMACAEALVMPSRMESFGLPYFEAMALGCPVVASDLDFAHDACADAALYADPDLPEAFASQVERIISDAALRAELKARQYRRYQAVACSWDDVARQYIDVLETMSISGEHVVI